MSVVEAAAAAGRVIRKRPSIGEISYGRPDIPRDGFSVSNSHDAARTPLSAEPPEPLFPGQGHPYPSNRVWSGVNARAPNGEERADSG
jgi:hypothetical protein